MNAKTQSHNILAAASRQSAIVLCFVLLSLYSITSCVGAPRPSVIERMEFCQVMTLDTHEGGYSVGVMIKNISPSSKGTGEEGGDEGAGNGIFVRSGASLHGIIRSLQASRPKSIFFGDIESVFVSSDVAKRGLEDIIDYMIHNKQFSDYASLYVVQGSAYRLLCDLDSRQIDPVQLIIKARLPEHSQASCNVNIIDSIALLKPHTSGVLPIIGGSGTEGLAIIKDGVWVGILQHESARALNILRNRLRLGSLTLRLGEMVYDLDAISARTTIRPKIRQGLVGYTIDVKIRAELVNDNCNQTQLASIQAALNAELHRQIAGCIVQAKIVKADIFGLFDCYRMRDKHSADRDIGAWGDIWPGLDIEVSVRSSIT
jgi:Ger(x)C family germination protein